MIAIDTFQFNKALADSVDGRNAAYIAAASLSVKLGNGRHSIATDVVRARPKWPTPSPRYLRRKLRKSHSPLKMRRTGYFLDRVQGASIAKVGSSKGIGFKFNRRSNFAYIELAGIMGRRARGEGGQLRMRQKHDVGYALMWKFKGLVDWRERDMPAVEAAAAKAMQEVFRAQGVAP